MHDGYRILGDGLKAHAAYAEDALHGAWSSYKPLLPPGLHGIPDIDRLVNDWSRLWLDYVGALAGAFNGSGYAGRGWEQGATQESVRYGPIPWHAEPERPYQSQRNSAGTGRSYRYAGSAHDSPSRHYSVNSGGRPDSGEYHPFAPLEMALREAGYGDRGEVEEAAAPSWASTDKQDARAVLPLRVIVDSGWPVSVLPLLREGLPPANLRLSWTEGSAQDAGIVTRLDFQESVGQHVLTVAVKTSGSAVRLAADIVDESSHKFGELLIELGNRASREQSE